MKQKSGLYWMILSIYASTFTGNALAEITSPLSPRPPQYVLLAFDGSLSLNMWKETLDFARENQLKFTYFISGVYFLLNSNKKQYIEPTHGAGKSAIGFGGKSAEDIHHRVEWVNTAYDEGNEIASHANGHFDGGKWTLEQWESEIDQFYNLIFDVFYNNGIFSFSFFKPYHFGKDQIRGFRAPLLGQNPAMYESLHRRAYTYDTSKVSGPTYWPEKIRGIWNFPLAEVRIAGTAKKTLTMDYNFYYAHSNGKPDPANFSQYKKEMTDTYLTYFFNNYYGNRAPVHIGHHFSKWNGGAYWEAMKEFAHEICGLPEVKCVTYAELNAFMESLPESTLAHYRKGNFEKFYRPSLLSHSDNRQSFYELNLKINSLPGRGTLQAQLFGKNAGSIKSHKRTDIIWKLDGQEIQRMNAQGDTDLDLFPYTNNFNEDSKISVSVELDGKELIKSTHKIETIFHNKYLSIPVLSKNADEDRALMGDLPEAHFDE